MAAVGPLLRVAAFDGAENVLREGSAECAVYAAHVARMHAGMQQDPAAGLTAASG